MRAASQLNASSRRSRDPYAVCVSYGTGASCLLHIKRQWLWVLRSPGRRRIGRVHLICLTSHGPLRIGIGGPVGSGKTALMDLLCKTMRERYEIAAITNDIYTKWDAEFLVRSGSLTPDRIAGVETGGCPHTAIREDASMNLAAVADMRAKFPDLDLVLIEIRRRQSRRHLLARTRRPHDLRDRRRGRRQDSLKGGPGITRSDLLVINKIDLAPHVGASLEKMDTDAQTDARRTAVRHDQSQEERRPRPHRRLYRGQGRSQPRPRAKAS